MLEKPPISEERILRCVEAEYGLSVEKLTFLPLGADLNTAVYRVEDSGGTAYFLKLRRGDFAEASVSVPNFLFGRGVREVIPAQAARSGRLWARLAPYTVILYPFIEGRDGFACSLTDRQWIAFGAAMKQFHAAEFPAALTRGIPREAFSPYWRETVRGFLERNETAVYTESVAVEMADFLNADRERVLDLLARAERCARGLRRDPAGFIVCHGDIHAWNLLVADAARFYMVDWDTLIWAPKERDLMFIGAGLGGRGRTPEEEEALFYRGYGPAESDPAALAYYRYARIVEDIGVYCQQIFLSDEGGEDRRQSLEYFKSEFQPGGMIEFAYRADRTRDAQGE